MFLPSCAVLSQYGNVRYSILSFLRLEASYFISCLLKRVRIKRTVCGTFATVKPSWKTWPFSLLEVFILCWEVQISKTSGPAPRTPAGLQREADPSCFSQQRYAASKTPLRGVLWHKGTIPYTWFDPPYLFHATRLSSVVKKLVWTTAPRGIKPNHGCYVNTYIKITS